MKQYIYKGPICNTIYRRYNKEYCTPPIYSAYNFNWILCLFGILTSVIFTYFSAEYTYVFFIELAFGLSYLVNSLIVKNAFTSGLLNKSLSDRSLMFVPVKILAYISQTCLFHVSIPMIMVIFGKLDVINELSPIMIAVACTIFIVNVILPFGVNCQKHYNKNAQLAYSYIIEGPSRANESVENIYQSLHVEPMHSLKHFDAATSKYYHARDAVSKSSMNLRKIIDNYDAAWRSAIICSQYMYEETMPCQTPQAAKLANAILSTNNEVKKLNVVIDTINASEYIPKIKKTSANKISSSNESRNSITVASEPSGPKEEPIVDIVWDYQVNWY